MDDGQAQNQSYLILKGSNQTIMAEQVAKVIDGLMCKGGGQGSRRLSNLWQVFLSPVERDYFVDVFSNSSIRHIILEQRVRQFHKYIFIIQQSKNLTDC